MRCQDCSGNYGCDEAVKANKAKATDADVADDAEDKAKATDADEADNAEVPKADEGL